MAYRRRGVHGRILQAVQGDAALLSKPVVLRVLRVIGAGADLELETVVCSRQRNGGTAADAP